MALKRPFAIWRNLSTAQRRHAQMAAGGIALSWALAAVMAYSHTTLPGSITRLADSTPSIQQSSGAGTEAAEIRLKP